MTEEKERGRLPFKRLIYWAEPHCWGCGNYWSGAYDQEWEEDTWSACVKAWKRLPLQRCHVVPRALGGSASPGNIVLLCRKCHDRAPDTVFPEVFWQWMDTQHHEREAEREIREVVKALGISPGSKADVSRISKALWSPEFWQWASDRQARHFPQTNSGQRVSVFGFVALLDRYLKSQTNDAAQTEPSDK